MKFTDDVFIKGLLNKFNDNLEAFLKDYCLKETQIGENLILVKSTVLDLFDKDSNQIQSLSSVFANISGALRVQLGKLDKNFYFYLDKILSNPQLEDDEINNDDKRELINEFPNRLQSLLSSWKILIKRVNKVLSQPSQLISARESWEQQTQVDNGQPEHKHNQDADNRMRYM